MEKNNSIEKKVVKQHKLELDNHRSLFVSGVLSVPVFTDKNITIDLEGEVLLVNGHNLEVKSLDIENEKLLVGGHVSSLKYVQSTSPKSIFKKIFK